MEGELQRAFGRNLLAYRKARGLSQEAFADVLGFHRTYMGDVERGVSQEAFADVLGVHRTYMGGIERGERNLTLKSVERIASQIELEALTLLLPDDAK